MKKVIITVMTMIMVITMMAITPSMTISESLQINSTPRVEYYTSDQSHQYLIDEINCITYEDAPSEYYDPYWSCVGWDGEYHSSLNYITETERVMLCNIVAGEYGSDWVPLFDKALVVEVVMNRVYDGIWGGSDIYSVLTAPYQFDGYYASDWYIPQVTDSCVAAVDYYFENLWLFNQGYRSFYGDGTWNYFR